MASSSVLPAPQKKVQEALIRDMIYADDAADRTDTQQEPQTTTHRLSPASNDFQLTISLKKANVSLGQDTEAPTLILHPSPPPPPPPPNYELVVAHHFTYLTYTVSSNISLDTEIDKRISKTTTTLIRLKL